MASNGAGPLVVLTNHLSASASEILAGAIQDYRRGLVIGDRATHGKGTVQSLLRLGWELFRIENAPKLGALKVTMQQFYRPNGDSTQKRGVVADIELPSLTTHADVGEKDLDFPVAFDQVAAAPFRPTNQVDPGVVRQLAARSAQRISSNPEFQKVAAAIEKFKIRKKVKRVPLNEEKYRAYRAELDLDKDQQNKIDKRNDPNRPVVERDYYFDEVLSISVDYAEALRRNRGAQVGRFQNVR